MWLAHNALVFMKHLYTYGLVLTLASLTSWLSGQIPFFTETFASAELPAGWSSADASVNASNLKVRWQVCANPRSCPPSECPPSKFDYFQEAFPQQNFKASTAANGYVYANSDSLFINTDIPHISQLTSVAIDCSQAEEVFLEFQTHIAFHNSQPDTGAVLLVSPDGGDNWTTYPIFQSIESSQENDPIFTLNPLTIQVDISPTAALQEEVLLRWQWTGMNEVVWALDDVRLFDQNPNHFRVVWGKEPGQGDFAGGLNGWSVFPTTVSEQWAWQAGSSVGRGFFAPDGFYVSSPTALNGAAVFDADFYNSGGEPINPGNLETFDSELISPIIDLSNTTGPLNLRFRQLVRPFNPQPDACPYVAAVSYSLNGGTTYENCVNATPGPVLPTYWIQDTYVLPLPEEAIGNPEFRLKFSFKGQLFAWAIDDVVIYERELHDLSIEPRLSMLAPNAVTPSFLVEPIYFLAEVLNEGTQLQTNVKVFVEVEQVNGPQYFIDSLTIDTLLAGDTLSQLFNNTFLPAAEPAEFKVRYFVRADSLDERPANNQFNWRFEISDSTYAKEFGPTAAFAPSGTGNYRYGNCYYIPPTTEQLFATSFTFGIGNAEGFSGKSIETYLYKWETGAAEGSTTAPSGNYEQVAGNAYTIEGDESFELITIPVNFDEQPIPLEPDSYYFAVAAYTGTVQEKCFMLASEEYDYIGTFSSYFVLVDQPRYFTMFSQGSNQTYYVSGLGAESGFAQIPVARLAIQKSVGAAEEARPSLDWSVQPNPIVETLRVRIDLANPPSDISFQLYNAAGQLLQQWEVEGALGYWELQIEAIPAGLYWLQAKIAGQPYSRPVIVARP